MGNKGVKGDSETKGTEKEKHQVTSVEDALETLGGFSWFQIWATCVVLFPEIPAATIVMIPIFTASTNVEFVVTGNESSILRSIHYKDPSICSDNLTLGLIPDLPVTSIVQEWQLVCSRAWITDFFTSIQMLGMMTGAFSASQLADAFGRKTVFYGAIVSMGTFCIGSGFAPNLYVYGVLKYFTGVGVGGFYVIYMIFLMEFLTPSWRTISGCLTIWSVGIITLAGLAYEIPAWRHLTIVGASPTILALLFYPLIPESPRWLLTKERTAEAEKGLKMIARMNGRTPIDKDSIEYLQASILSEKNQKEVGTESGEKSSSTKQSVLELFKSPKLRYQLFLFLFGWFTIAFVYYGMSFNTKNLSGNPYLNVLYLGLVDLPAFPSGVLFNNWLGRRKTYAGYLMFAAACLMALVVVDQSTISSATDSHVNSDWNQSLVMILCYMGRFGVAGAWGVASCFTAESFPTVCRSTALGLCALFANTGGVLAPQLVYLGSISTSIPYCIFGGLSLLAAASSWLLSETNKLPLQNFVKR